MTKADFQTRRGLGEKVQDFKHRKWFSSDQLASQLLPWCRDRHRIRRGLKIIGSDRTLPDAEKVEGMNSDSAR
jgi:hypothetical protein